MAKSDKINNWKERIRAAKKIHKERIENPVKRNLKYYRGDQWLDEGVSQMYNDKAVDNVIFSNIATIKPSINMSNPKIFVRPRSPVKRTEDGVMNTIVTAKLVQVLANYDYKELELKREFDKVLVDSLLAPYGFIQCGYTLKTEKFKEKSDKQIEIHELIKEDNVFAVRRSPLDLLVDPEATDHLLNDAGWIAIRDVKSLQDIKDNPRYKNTKNLKPNARVDIEKMGGGDTKTVDAEEMERNGDSDIWAKVEMWHIYDKKNNREMTYVDGHNGFLRDEPWSLDFEGFPVEILYFNENPDDFYPVSDVDTYIKSQDELNQIISMNLDHLRRISRRRYVARKDSMDTDDEDQLMNGPDGVVVMVDGDPSTSIVPLRDAVISQDIYIIAKQRKDSIREQSGINQFEKGIPGGTEQTATASALINQGTKTRRSDREQSFKAFVVRVIRKLLKIRQQTLDSDISINLSDDQFKDAQNPDQFGIDIVSKLEKITAPGGDTALLPWIKMSKADIQGEFLFDIDISTLRARNEDQERQEAVALYQMASQDPMFNGDMARRNLLEKFNIANIDDWMRDPQEVQQEQAQAAEAQIAAQIEVDKPKRETDLAKTQIKTAQNERDSQRRFQKDMGNLIQQALKE